MLRSSKFLIFGVAAAALVAVSGAAFASHGKVGLWSVTVTMGGGNPMPDMSKLPPEVQARMKAAGVSASGNSITAQHCMSAQEVATDNLSAAAQNKDCTYSNMQTAGKTMSADLVCKGQFNGTGHMQTKYSGDGSSFSGDLTMSGAVNGHQMNQSQHFEGHWVSADCGGITH
ncbi:MAG TPA: DUF3617 domain-containing protein [Rhizomicrobium sp.]